MIGGQARNLALDPSFKMLPMAADLGVAQFRRVVQQLLDAENDGAQA